MISRGDIVLVDTNVIIEANRVGCWRAIVKFFKVETVEKCSEEAATGERRRANYVAVDVQDMKKVVTIHPISLLELVQVETRLAEPDRIDIGEKHLLAHALATPEAWYLSASDRAAVRAGSELGYMDRFVSLEALARGVGMTPQFKNHFTEKWLSALRMEILMGGLQ